ncbi:MAG: TIGR01777 family protein [Micromonosporaceae bacterium]|nr:TIGR01777 family protein [Micromonosporaceae bacterium]
MRIVAAGSSGFLGSLLVDQLRADGHQVVRLVRRAAAGPDEVSWQPETGSLDPAVLAGAAAVVNLAGAGVGDRRWTASYRRLLRTSRVEPTATLAETIAAAPAATRPAVLLNASAVGWYGDTGDTEVDEQTPPGEGFFPDLCRVWEAATGPAEAAGVRVVRLRTGLPLHGSGGLLKPMLLQFRVGLGGKFGSGRHWLPWVSMLDWLASVQLLLTRDDLAGPVNLVGPDPVTNADFTRALGSVLHRPTVMPIPALALRIALGEFGNEAVASQRVVPGVLNRAGFQFRHGDVRSALRAALAPLR